MSDTIIGRVDEMSSRIDELEKSIQDLMVQVRARLQFLTALELPFFPKDI